jgi:hypothetical protein
MIQKRKYLNKKQKHILKFRKKKYLTQVKYFNIVLDIFLNDLSKAYLNKIDIRFAPNNIFGTCSLNLGANVLKSVSAGLLKLKSSRKMKKHIFYKFLNNFLKIVQEKFEKKKANNKFYYDNTLLTIIASKKFRRKIEKSFSIIRRNKISDNSLLYIIRAKKCFNGCRVPKKRRKKRIRFRVFK